jgi:molybdopterin-synthase adenylyltransferase
VEEIAIPNRYSRQVLFGPIGRDGQRRIMQGRAVLIGCGGLGTVIADILVRAGVGFLRIVDRDFVEESNLQRQVLFDEDDVKKNLPKAEAARRALRRIDSHADVEAVVRDVDSTCVLDLVRDADVILDGADNFEVRYLLNDAAIRLRKPWIYGAVVGSYGMTASIVPGVTPCLRCLFDAPPPPGATPTCDTAGVLSSAVHVIASIQASEALKILSGGAESVKPRMVTIDLWKHDYRSDSLQEARNPECEACGRGNLVYLNAERGSFVTSLCGRNAVQISWKDRHEVDFDRLAETLAASGEVTVNRFLLRYRNPEVTITLFPDGRAIVEGTPDLDRARELYAKYIG